MPSRNCSRCPSRNGRKTFFLRSRGNAELAAGDLAAAAADFTAVTALAATPDGDYQRLWALEGQARVKRAQGDDAAALQSYRQAVVLVNALRARFRSDEFKTGLFGDVQQIFDAALALSVAEQDYAAAWELSEASRARELLDTVRSRANDTLSQQLPLAEVQRALDGDDVLLQYHAVGNAMVVWVIRRDSIRGRTLPLREADLARQVDAFRDSIINRRTDTRALGQGLYEALVAPAELGTSACLRGAARAAALPAFPGALHRHGYLIGRIYALSVWPWLRRACDCARAARAQRRLAARLRRPDHPEENVPSSRRRAPRCSSSAACSPSTRSTCRAKRPRRASRRRPTSAALLHVAAHAEVDEVDPLFSRILFSSSPAETGLLEAREIFRLDLGAVKLVTLSACESGLGKVSRGEEIVGFTRSFLSAGADSVIASLWPVADESTELLMTKLYQELVAGRDLASAMQAAQIEVQRNRRFAHPFFWAPFYVIGNGQLKLAA